MATLGLFYENKCCKQSGLYKKTLSEPEGKQRNKVTHFIANNHSRQEKFPPFGKYVCKLMAEPLHNMNNAWQSWFKNLLVLATSLCNQSVLKSCRSFHAIPKTSPLVQMIGCVKEKLKCGRLYKSYCRWFNEKKRSGIDFSYRFTGLESKRVSWKFYYLINVLLDSNNVKNGARVKLRSLHYVAMLLRETTSLFTRVNISREEILRLQSLCTDYFTCNILMLDKITPTIWTVAYAIPYHTSKFYSTFGHGLGLNSMQGRKAKHMKLRQHIVNTCNGRNTYIQA